MKKIILTGCKRYNQNGELFLDKDNGGNPEVYALDDARADYLLAQFDHSTGFSFFELYQGAEAGKTPSKIKDEVREHNVNVGPKPRQQNDRRPRSERPGRAPKQVADNPKASGPIEDADAVTV